MKASELIKELEKNPDWDIIVSMDVSKNEDDSDRRIFGDKVIEVINERNRKEYVICLEGHDNYEES